MATISRREMLVGMGTALAVAAVPWDGSPASARGPGARTGTTADTAAATGPNGTIRSAAYGAPATLDPHAMAYGQPIQFAQPVYETLIRKLPDQTYVPMLATEWGYVDDARHGARVQAPRRRRVHRRRQVRRRAP